MADISTLWLLSWFFQFPMITDIYLYICSIPYSFSFLYISSPLLIWKMDITLEKLKRYFPTLPRNTLTKIYCVRCERLRLLMNHSMPKDICWIIEVKVRLWSESSNSRTCKNTFAKKRRAKRLKVYHKYAIWTCNAQCHYLGMIFINHEDKIQFIKDGLSKESLDNFVLTIETHPSRDVHHVIDDL
jgi:hypothetical protein